MYNKYTFFSIIVSTAIMLASCGGKPNYRTSLKTDADSASYFMGYYYGTGCVNMGFNEVNTDAFAKGVLEAVKKDSVDQASLMAAQNFLNDYFTKMQDRKNEEALMEGKAFLDANKVKPGVVTLPSGLQYKIIKEGTGPKPTTEDMVDVVYHGTLIDGTVFDSSRVNGDTVSFPVGGVVQGFSEALTLMNEGSKWEVYIPAELGYGVDVPPGSPIKPNSTLIFELDLVKIVEQGN